MYPKRVEKVLFVANNPSILKFFTHHKSHLLRKKTNSLTDDVELPDYFCISFSAGRKYKKCSKLYSG